MFEQRQTGLSSAAGHAGDWTIAATLRLAGERWSVRCGAGTL